MSTITSQIATHWKTSLQGFMVTLGAWAMEIQVLGIKSWSELWTLPHVCAVIIALAPTVIGVIQKDAGVQEAVTPSGETVAVASHEQPDNPANKPVTKGTP